MILLSVKRPVGTQLFLNRYNPSFNTSLPLLTITLPKYLRNGWTIDPGDLRKYLPEH